MIRKWIFALSMLIFVSLSGCDAAHTQNNAVPEKEPVKNTSADDVTPTVSAVFKNSETTEKTNRFENDDIRIYKEYIDDGYEHKWMQENLDGTEKKELPFGTNGNFLWLTNDWIYYYYTQFDEACNEDDYRICRIPIENKNGVTYNTTNKEILFQVRRFQKTEFMVTDNYIIYGIYLTPFLSHETMTYYRYDFQTRNSERVFDLDFAYCDIDCLYMGIYSDVCTDLPVTYDNAFFMGGEDGVYIVPFDTLEPTKIYSGRATNIVSLEYLVDGYIRDSSQDYLSHDTDCLMATDGSALYFTPTGRELMIYEKDNTTADCVLSEDALKDTLRKMNLWDTSDTDSAYLIEGMRIRNHRLILNVTGFWQRNRADSEHPYPVEREVLISADLSNLNEWEMEKALSDYILENAVSKYLYFWSEESCQQHEFLSTNRLETENDNTVSRACYLYDLGDGKILVSYFAFSPGKKPTGVDGVVKKELYDMDCKKIMPLDNDYPPYCQRQWVEGDNFDFKWNWPTYFDEYLNS